MNTILLSPDLSQRLAERAATLDLSQLDQAPPADPELQALAHDILERVDHRGLTVVENVTGDPDQSLFALMLLVGKPIHDANSGPMIMDLKPTPHTMTADTTSYYSWNEFDFHTDLSYVPAPPDFITVLCVQPDAQGAGLSVFSDVRTSPLSRGAIGELTQPNFSFRPPPHYREKAAVKKPVLSLNANGDYILQVRFDRMSADTPEAEAALKELYDALNENRIAFLLPKHAAYIADNRRVVHGRTPFTPNFSASDRHLKRILGVRR